MWRHEKEPPPIHPYPSVYGIEGCYYRWEAIVGSRYGKGSGGRTVM